MRRGPEPGKLYHLASPRIKLGRGSKNDIIINDNEVSREHLHLVRVDAGYELHDLNSSNGTFVNGHQVQDVWVLQTRCIVELGDTITFEYRTDLPDDADLLPDEDTADEREPNLVVIVSSQPEPIIYPLTEEVVTIGREMTNDIVIVEPEMSRNHLRITRGNDGFTVEDLGSTNGTLLNGEPLTTSRPLEPEDILQVGTMVQMQFTRRPEQFSSHIKTGLLGDARSAFEEPTDLNNKRRTTAMLSPPEIALENPPSPTAAGTGVEGQDLGDKAFITYHREDWKTVAPVVDRLAEAGVGVWVDQYLTPGTNDWWVATEQARLECWLLVVVISTRGLKSEQVKKNWLHFRNRDKPIILFVSEPVDRMPIGSEKVATIHYNPAIPDVAVRQLVEAIEKARS